jgi:hypothetical protein
MSIRPLAGSLAFLLCPVAFANSGVQLRLDQYQAGSETTNNTVVTNSGFESVDGSNNATNWGYDVNFNELLKPGTPDAGNPTVPGTATGTRSAQARSITKDFNYAYMQKVTLQPNTDYVLSGYVWNYGIAGAAPHNDLNAGDLAVLQLRDPSNYLNTAGVILEPVALDGQSGSRGYFTYKTFNSSQFGTLTVDLEVLYDPNENLFSSRPTLAGQFDNVAITALGSFSSQRWQATGSGTWGTNSNWLNNQANVDGAVAYLGNAITGAATITLEAAKRVAAINFDSNNSYTLAGGGTLTLAHAESGFKGEAVVLNVLLGSHTILAPVTVGTGTVNLSGWINVDRQLKLNVNNAASVLTIDQTITSFANNPGGTGTASIDYIKNGAGRSDLRSYRGDSLTVNAGTARVIAGGGSLGTSRLNTLTLVAGTKFDLTDHALVVDYSTTSPIADIQALINTAYASGSWSGNGLTSSSAQAAASTTKKTSLALIEATDIATSFPTMFEGQSVDETTVLVRYSLLGDSNFDNKVNTLDFNVLAANFGGSSKRWTQGDFNYSGTTDSIDFGLMVANFGASLPASTPSLGSVVPEPSTIAILAFAALSGVRSRRLQR